MKTTFKNKALSQFKDLPSNFLEWLLQPAINIGWHKYSLEDAKKIYKENSEKDLGFIYRKYHPMSASLDNSWYDEYDVINRIELNISSIGEPNIFFGSIINYKTLLGNLIIDNNISPVKNSYNVVGPLRNFYQFGQIYCFKESKIKNPIDIF